MFDHVRIRVSDLDAAVAFYAAIARHTGLREGRRWQDGRQFRGAWATFSLVADGTPPTENLHVAFPAPDRRTVEDFYRCATAAGCRDNGAPGERLSGQSGYYGVQILDSQGTIVESVFRPRG
jgi:catechol 2,3-dioxygenase-like lactoylglutathione lyase family enzyme